MTLKTVLRGRRVLKKFLPAPFAIAVAMKTIFIIRLVWFVKEISSTRKKILKTNVLATFVEY